MIENINIKGCKVKPNKIYKIKEKKIDLLNNGSSFKCDIIIETGQFQGGYQFLNILIGVDDEWSTAFSSRYISEKLYEVTKIADYIGEQLKSSNLSFFDGANEIDSYFFTSNYNDSVEVLKEITAILGILELSNEDDNELTSIGYTPYSSFKKLKNNVEETVKDLNNINEIEESIKIYMDHEGEDYRSALYLDSQLIYQEELDLKIVDSIEDIMFEYFNEDEILLEDEE